MTKRQLQEQLAYLRARYDDGAISPAIYEVVKRLEREISWLEYQAAEKRNQAT